MLQLATYACSGLLKSGAFVRATAPNKRQAMSDVISIKACFWPAYAVKYLRCAQTYRSLYACIYVSATRHETAEKAVFVAF